MLIGNDIQIQGGGQAIGPLQSLTCCGRVLFVQMTTRVLGRLHTYAVLGLPQCHAHCKVCNVHEGGLAKYLANTEIHRYPSNISFIRDDAHEECQCFRGFCKKNMSLFPHSFGANVFFKSQLMLLKQDFHVNRG